MKLLLPLMLACAALALAGCDPAPKTDDAAANNAATNGKPASTSTVPADAK